MKKFKKIIIMIIIGMVLGIGMRWFSGLTLEPK
jgi:hypothetical protein